MSVTINGNGTITGYTPPVADGSITAAKLASGAISASTLPAGTVIQTVTQKVDQSSMTDITSSTTTFTGLYAEITPHLSNSKIIVLVNMLIYISGGGMDTGAAITIQRKIGSGSYSILDGSKDAQHHQQFYAFEGGGNIELISTFSDTCFDTPGTNSEVVRYQIFGSAHSGGTVNLTTNNSNNHITLLEIKV